MGQCACRGPLCSRAHPSRMGLGWCPSIQTRRSPMKEYRNPPDVHAPLAAYTHQIEISNNERMLLLSGQVGLYEDGTAPEDASLQLGLALENLHRNLRHAGMEMIDVVKLTLYLVDEIPAEERARVLAYRMGNNKPCMTLVYVKGLAKPEYRVEVDAWASHS